MLTSHKAYMFDMYYMRFAIVCQGLGYGRVSSCRGYVLGGGVVLEDGPGLISLLDCALGQSVRAAGADGEETYLLLAEASDPSTGFGKHSPKRTKKDAAKATSRFILIMCLMPLRRLSQPERGAREPERR